MYTAVLPTSVITNTKVRSNKRFDQKQQQKKNYKLIFFSSRATVWVTENGMKKSYKCR